MSSKMSVNDYCQFCCKKILIWDAVSNFVPSWLFWIGALGHSCSIHCIMLILLQLFRWNQYQWNWEQIPHLLLERTFAKSSVMIDLVIHERIQKCYRPVMPICLFLSICLHMPICLFVEHLLGWDKPEGINTILSTQYQTRVLSLLKHYNKAIDNKCLDSKYLLWYISASPKTL